MPDVSDWNGEHAIGSILPLHWPRDTSALPLCLNRGAGLGDGPGLLEPEVRGGQRVSPLAKAH